VRAATSGGVEGTAAGGVISVGAVLVAVGLGCREGGVTVVTVSGGSTGTKLGRGDALRLGGTTTVADVDALSPPLTITTVAMTASTKTIPEMAAIGRHR
jgi:hypothetical protein